MTSFEVPSVRYTTIFKPQNRNVCLGYGSKCENEGVFWYIYISSTAAGPRRPKSPHKWHAAHGYAFPVIGIMAEWLRRQTRNLVGSARVGSNPADVVSSIFFSIFIFSCHGPVAHAQNPKATCSSSKRARRDGRITQGSVQIVLIFRLLLKITVDWPFHAISMCL